MGGRSFDERDFVTYKNVNIGNQRRANNRQNW
jgi:hypothetical protein